MEKKLSKSQRRKLAKIEEDKRKREARAGVVARLNAAKLVSDESLSLLQGSDRMGQRLSKRETLRRELKAERARNRPPRLRELPIDQTRATGRRRGRRRRRRERRRRRRFRRRRRRLRTQDQLAEARPVRRRSATQGVLRPHPPPRPGATRRRTYRRRGGCRVGRRRRRRRRRRGDCERRRRAREVQTCARGARKLAAQIRQRDPEQAAEAAVEALGPAAAAAAIDPKDAAAQLAAANEAATAAAAAKFPGCSSARRAPCP